MIEKRETENIKKYKTKNHNGILFFFSRRTIANLQIYKCHRRATIAHFISFCFSSFRFSFLFICLLFSSRFFVARASFMFHPNDVWMFGFDAAIVFYCFVFAYLAHFSFFFLLFFGNRIFRFFVDLFVYANFLYTLYENDSFFWFYCVCVCVRYSVCKQNCVLCNFLFNFQRI